MYKAKTTTYPLIIAAMFLAAIPLLPSINAQSRPPAPAPMIMAPSPSSDCFPYIANMSDCLSYVQPGSSLTKPESDCCRELSHLVNTQPICLCQLLSNSTDLGIQIDKNKALKLPSACRVNTPPLSACGDIGEPVSVPVPTGGPSHRSSAPGNENNRDIGEPVSVHAPTGGPSQRSSAPGNENNQGPNLYFLVGLAILLLTSFF